MATIISDGKKQMKSTPELRKNILKLSESALKYSLPLEKKQKISLTGTSASAAVNQNHRSVPYKRGTPKSWTDKTIKAISENKAAKSPKNEERGINANCIKTIYKQ